MEIKRDTNLQYELLNAMNLIVSSMNHEEAYYGAWLYTWPDEADEEEVREMAEGDYFDEVAAAFFHVCKVYGKDGLYTGTFA